MARTPREQRRRCAARALAALAPAAIGLALAGCGAGVSAADLFVVTRTGSTPRAHLTLLVSEEGGVRCNGGPTLKLRDSQLVKARAIQEELEQPSARHLTLPPRAGSVFSYFLRDEHGWVRFSDNSSGQSAIMHELQLFVVSVAQQICHLPE
jgi:hypothetical protein